jgi:glutaredoxin
MPRQTVMQGLAVFVAALLLAAGVQAQDKQVYRYVDAEGRVVYSDKPPPANAKDAQTKRVGGNYIETDPMSISEQQATERYPVTLYTFACGELCDDATGLLNKRGVPFTSIDVQTPDGAKKLQAISGEMTAPVLAVGDKLVYKGYNEARWQQMLDDAGYPKTPSPRTSQVGRAPVDAAPPADTRAQTVPGGGYPKN